MSNNIYPLQGVSRHAHSQIPCTEIWIKYIYFKFSLFIIHANKPLFRGRQRSVYNLDIFHPFAFYRKRIIVWIGVQHDFVYILQFSVMSVFTWKKNPWVYSVKGTKRYRGFNKYWISISVQRDRSVVRPRSRNVRLPPTAWLPVS